MKINNQAEYNAAKKTLEIPHVDFIMNAQGLRDQMLEYRRANNIFEVGDLVVYRTLPHERLFSVRYVNDNSIVIYELWDEMGAKTFSEFVPYSDIRHATDAEIKANRRIDLPESVIQSLEVE